MTETTYSTGAVAEMYNVSRQAVGKWINQGLLRAERNSPSPRSEWRITQSALDEFEKARQAASQPAKS